MSAPDHDALAAALEAADVPATAAEVHGIVTAASCLAIPAPAWLALVLGRANAPEALHAELAALHAHTVAQLGGEEFEFEPLLPPSGAGLGEQVEAVAEWCRGFLLAVNAGAGAAVPGLSADAREVLDDLAQIAAVEPDADDEEAARALAEIVEYLRVGVQLLYDERHPGPRSK